MKQLWLNKSNNENLIVFFNGWGMDEKIVSHLNFENHDVLMFYNYTDLEYEPIDFSQYKNKYLIAWSMGVFTCNKLFNVLENFDKKIAINGTKKPIDDNYGIPVLFYDLMIENFNELTSEKFVRKISTGDNTKELCTRTKDELKEELIKIKFHKIDKFIKFDKAIISLRDRIIPPKNQQAFWELENTEIVEIKALHSIFDMYSNWAELL